jgi:hypothetical protein
MPALAYGDVNHNGHDSHLHTLLPSRGNGPEQLAIALLHEPLDLCAPVSGYAAVEPCRTIFSFTRHLHRRNLTAELNEHRSRMYQVPPLNL